MSNTAFIYNTPHPAHEAFAKAIDADFYPLVEGEPAPSGPRRLFQYVRSAWSFPKGYDYYLLEGGRPLLSAALFDVLQHTDSDVVLLNADETLINVVDGLSYYSEAERLVHKISLPAVDGVISVGEFINEYVAKTGMDVPTEVVRPPIQPGPYESLGAVTPSLDANTIVSVAEGKPAVGFDILIEAFIRVREDFPDAKLHIVGRGHPDKWGKHDGVTVHGWVDDLVNVFQHASLSVHPGRAECFPVAVLEALHAGVPCIVSDRVGTKSVVSQVDESLVVDPTVDATASAIRSYFALPLDRRRELSARGRELTTEFTVEEQAGRFAERYGRLTSRLSG